MDSDITLHFVTSKGETMQITRLQCEEFKAKFGYYPINMDIFAHVKCRELEKLNKTKEELESKRKLLRMKKDIQYPYGYAPKCVTSRIGVISNKLTKINKRIEQLESEDDNV